MGLPISKHWKKKTPQKLNIQSKKSKEKNEKQPWKAVNRTSGNISMILWCWAIPELFKRKERKAALESGEQDVWKYFNDSVVLGDSRAVGFEYHGFISEDRVFAEGGATIRNIPDYINGIKKVNPSSIILCFGLNDISIGYWNTSEEYIKELDEMLALLQKELPEATVFVNSILPATDPAFEQSEKWRNIPDWNKDIKEHCEEEKTPYIDIIDVVKEHKNLYDTDGIHMKKEFYPYWAIAIITEVTENE